MASPPAGSANPGTSDGDSRLVPAYGLYYLDNQPVVLRAGHFPYWRVPAGRWAEGLEGLCAAGCNAVLVSVPWAWHAPAPGTPDLRGATLPERDLGAFLDLAQRVGLMAHVVPGPALA
ncbi:MAG: beta-galactosidase, partial [Chloroflexota bacterium]|nr:beta-galactosidase [Chloroflexota bacterium]